MRGVGDTGGDGCLASLMSLYALFGGVPPGVESPLGKQSSRANDHRLQLAKPSSTPNLLLDAPASPLTPWPAGAVSGAGAGAAGSGGARGLLRLGRRQGRGAEAQGRGQGGRRQGQEEVPVLRRGAGGGFQAGTDGAGREHAGMHRVCRVPSIDLLKLRVCSVDLGAVVPRGDAECSKRAPTGNTHNRRRTPDTGLCTVCMHMDTRREAALPVAKITGPKQFVTPHQLTVVSDKLSSPALHCVEWNA